MFATKIILFSSILIIVIPLTTNTFAYFGQYEEWPRQLYNQPRICIFQPPDPRVDEITWKTWYKESKKAVEEWESMLKQHDQAGRGNWGIDYVEIPIKRVSSLNPNACDITVIFRDANSNDDGANGWYFSDRKAIEVIMVQMTYCGKAVHPVYHITINLYCRGNDLERASKMAATVRHEIGHAFGLGHYVTDDIQVMQSWYDNPSGHPSIMVGGHNNEQKRSITLLDIEQVYKIHPNGFGEKRNEIPVFVEDNPKPDLVDTLDFSNTQTRLIMIKRGEPVLEKITGNVPNGLFMKGKDVEILIIKPDRTYEKNKARVSEELYFEYPFRVDENTPKGKYQIQISYFDQEIKKIEFEVVDKIVSNTNTPTKAIKTPSVLKTQKPMNKESINSPKVEYDKILTTDANIDQITKTKQAKPSPALTKQYKQFSKIVSDTDDRLTDVYYLLKDAKESYTSDKSKSHLKNADELYMKAIGSISDLKSELSQFSFDDYYGITSEKLDKLESKHDKINSDIKEMKKKIDSAKMANTKQNSPQNKKLETPSQKQCFLFWC